MIGVYVHIVASGITAKRPDVNTVVEGSEGLWRGDGMTNITHRPVSMDANWFKCATCGAKVVVNDYCFAESERLAFQHKCQECASGEIKTLWSR